jgi:hypothetical protein
MRQRIEAAIVRIYASSGAIVGAGFLTGERQMLTCAHVVATALGIPEGVPEMPTDDVVLDFPLVGMAHTLTARVVHWDAERDVAGLELTDAPPDDAQPVPLVTADDLWGHHFRAFGFPSGYEDGVWASGVLRGQTAAGWVQIEDVKDPGYWVQPGFSGTPVWNEQLDGVAGITVAADTDRTTKAAFMIPTQSLIEAWPDLAAHTLEAGGLAHIQMQLARLEKMQHRSADPSRFQPQIDALREKIAACDGRVERQRECIAEGLEAQRRQRIEERQGQLLLILHKWWESIREYEFSTGEMGSASQNGVLPADDEMAVNLREFEAARIETWPYLSESTKGMINEVQEAFLGFVANVYSGVYNHEVFGHLVPKDVMRSEKLEKILFSSEVRKYAFPYCQDVYRKAMVYFET